MNVIAHLRTPDERQGIRGCPAMHVVGEAGHFVQEHGKAIAEEAVRALGA